MEIRKIDTRKKSDLSKFIKLPFNLYKSDPNWVPPMINDIKLSLDRESHPLYKHSHADFFIAESKSEVLGRIAAIDNNRYKDYKGEKTGFVYFFESVNDQNVAGELFSTVFKWAKNRDLDRVIGPKGLAQGDGHGLLVEGFQHKPAIGIPYNPEFYPELFEMVGLRKEIDYLSGYLTTDYEISDHVHKLADRIKKRRNMWVKEFETKDEMREWIPRIREVYNQAFIDVPGFVPLTQDEVQLIANKILSVAAPKLIKLIFKGDELIGFLFSYHNISEGIQKARGRMFPFGWFHLMRSFKKTKWADINGIGLLPGHQGVGANAVLYTELEKSLKSYPFQIADIVQVAEINQKSLAEANMLGVVWHKRHRIYKYDL